MNNIFSIKSKIHRFINLMFYGLFFIAGYLIGSGFNFNNLLNYLKNIF